MDDAEWIAAFTRTATALYDPVTFSFVTGVEPARLCGIGDPGQLLAPWNANDWRNTLMATPEQVSPGLGRATRSAACFGDWRSCRAREGGLMR